MRHFPESRVSLLVLSLSGDQSFLGSHPQGPIVMRNLLPLPVVGLLLICIPCVAYTNAAQPHFEKYATIEAYCDDVPVYSLGNITYIYGVSPDQLSGVVVQEGNENTVIKIKPKKS